MKQTLKKKLLVVSLISGVSLFANLAIQAEIYKWTDAKGVIHYSAQKPLERKIKSENIEQEIRSAAGKYIPSTEQVTSTNETPGKENSKNTNVKLDGPSPELVKYCKSQRKNLSDLSKNYRTMWQGKDGKKTRLDQKQRQEKANQIKESIMKECVGV